MSKNNSQPSFICDDNLGKLAKLLRASGYDTLFYRFITDGDLLAHSLKDERYIITRDNNLINKGAPGELLILIDSDNSDEQLKQVVATLGLKPQAEQWMTRCLDCNNTLTEVSKEDYRDSIPPYVYKTQELFFHCADCDKLYWKGTHHQRLTERLQRAFSR